VLASAVGRVAVVGVWWLFAFFAFLAVECCARNIPARLYHDPMRAEPRLLPTRDAVLLALIPLLLTYPSETLALYVLAIAAFLLIATAFLLFTRIRRAKHLLPLIQEYTPEAAERRTYDEEGCSEGGVRRF